MSNVSEYLNVIEPVSVTIANGQTVSSVAQMNAARAVGIIVPASMTGTSLTFSVSVDGITYNTLKDAAGSDYTITITSSASAHEITANKLVAWPYVKLVSGSAESGDKVLQLIPHLV
jgi:hypothetical protein